MVAQLANLALFFVGPIALFFIIYAGWMIIASGGDEEKVKKGKKIIIQVAL
jgi:hypothetical protein